MLHLLSDLMPLVIRNAPMLATTLLSPFAGAVTSIFCDAFNTDPAKPEDLIENIKNDPAAEDKLHALEMTHGLKFKNMLGSSNLSNMKITIDLTWNQTPGN